MLKKNHHTPFTTSPDALVLGFDLGTTVLTPNLTTFDRAMGKVRMSVESCGHQLRASSAAAAARSWQKTCDISNFNDAIFGFKTHTGKSFMTCVWYGANLSPQNRLSCYSLPVAISNRYALFDPYAFPQ